MGGGAQAFGGVKVGGGVGVSTPPVFERPPRVSGKNTRRFAVACVTQLQLGSLLSILSSHEHVATYRLRVRQHACFTTIGPGSVRC